MGTDILRGADSIVEDSQCDKQIDNNYDRPLEEIIRAEQQAALKARIEQTYYYLIKWFEDRDSRDNVARQVWWENFEWLKRNGWWHFRALQHWIRDQDHLKAQKKYADPRAGLPLIFQALDYLVSRKARKHRPHKGGRGLSSGCTGSRAEGAPVHYPQIRERSLGGEMIPAEGIKELHQFGSVDYGYGKWIRTVLKEGKYGKFLSLEGGYTIAGKDDDTGELKTDTVTKYWFNIPTEDVVLKEIARMLTAASEYLTRPPDNT